MTLRTQLRRSVNMIQLAALVAFIIATAAATRWAHHRILK